MVNWCGGGELEKEKERIAGKGEFPQLRLFFHLSEQPISSSRGLARQHTGCKAREQSKLCQRTKHKGMSVWLVAIVSKHTSSI